VLLAAIIGCSGEQKKNEQVAQKIDEASRLLANASNLLTVPFYVDKTTGEVGPILHKVEAANVAVPATIPAGNDKVVKLLDAAEGLLKDAIAAGASEPGINADAYALLGQLGIARARYSQSVADKLLDDARWDRQRAEETLDALRTNVMVATFDQALITKTRADIEAKKTAVATELTKFEADVKTLEGTIARLDGEIKALAKEKETLTTQANALQDKSSATSGKEGIDLLAQAQALEKSARQKDNEIETRQAAMENAVADKTALERQRDNAKAQLVVMDGHLQKTDEQGKAVVTQGVDAKKLADADIEVIGKSADSIAKLCAQAVASDTAGLSALDQAVKNLAKAAEFVNDQITQVRGLTDRDAGLIDAQTQTLERRQAALLNAQAAAMTQMGDILSRQLGVAKANAEIAATVAAAATTLGEKEPAFIVSLKQCVPGGAEVSVKAGDAYKKAEDLIVTKVLPLAGKSVIGQKTQWMYQAALAAAYTGHYLLTGDAAVKSSAQDLVTKALAGGKEGSPYLQPVVKLRDTLAKTQRVSQPTPTTEKAAPAATPTE
jgi:predicted  nucleic acid-binding Zn-ribbon protein